MKNQIIVLEPNMCDGSHAEVNAGLLQIIEDIYKGSKLKFIADSKHIDTISKRKDLKNYSLTNVKVFSYSPKFLFINELLLLLRIIKILFSTRHQDVIFLLGILPINHIILSYINIFLRRNIVIVLHGQMEAFLTDTKIGKTKYYYRLSQSVFRKKDLIRYIVFGESIKKNIAFLFADESKMIIIDQPYVFEENELSPDIRKNNKIVVGLIGRADKGKNIDEFFQFVRELKKEIITGQIEVKIVGKLFEKNPADCEGLFSYHTQKIDDATMEREIQSLDYALSFTDKKFYRATPSGVVFDCIKWEKPILGLKNDFLAFYFKKYGDFGCLFDSTTQMVNYIKKHLEDETCFYKKNYEEVFNRLKKDLNIHNIKQLLKSQI